MFPPLTPGPGTLPMPAAFNMEAQDPFSPRIPSLLPVVIDPLLVDRLAHDFKVEPTYRANMHAFVDVSFFYYKIFIAHIFKQIALSDGQLGKSDIVTRLYMLAASFADMSERHRLAADQGAVDLKGLYQDIMAQLSGTYSLTNEQKASLWSLIALLCNH